MENQGKYIVPLLTGERDESSIRIVEKLQKEAESGNMEAVRTLNDLQEKNMFYLLVNNMDEDELAD